MKHHGSFRRKTRGKLSKHYKNKGKLAISKFFQKFKDGDKVVLKADPAYQKGLYYPRFHGKTGTVKGLRGECYIVEIKDGKKKKDIIVHPIHLKRSG